MVTYVEDGSKLRAVGEAASIMSVHRNTSCRWAEAGFAALVEDWTQAGQAVPTRRGVGHEG